MSENEKSALDLAVEAAEAKATAVNAGRTGIGYRQFVGKTRGKNPVVITYENFDTSKPDTVPTSIANFMEVTGKNIEKDIVGYLIEGINQELYTSASDPLAEFVDETWPADAQTQFRLVVRNYSRGANVSLDDAVALIKPGFVAQFSKK